MKIAIPVDNGQLNPHFGHCTAFALFDVSPENQRIENTTEVTAPPHEPGKLPGWLKAQNVDLIITGGMGQRALDLCSENQIDVILGAHTLTPSELIAHYLQGRLDSAANACGGHTCEH